MGRKRKMKTTTPQTVSARLGPVELRLSGVVAVLMRLHLRQRDATSCSETAAQQKPRIAKTTSAPRMNRIMITAMAEPSDQLKVARNCSATRIRPWSPWRRRAERE